MNRLTQMQLMHLVAVIAGQHEMAKEHNINKISVAQINNVALIARKILKTHLYPRSQRDFPYIILL